MYIRLFKHDCLLYIATSWNYAASGRRIAASANSCHAWTTPMWQNHFGHASLLSHPVVGASWEGFVLEQVIRLSGWREYYYWATYAGAELDILAMHNGKRYGVEIKFTDAPRVTRSMYAAFESLQLEHLWVVAPVPQGYPLAPSIDVVPLSSWPVM